jgi:integrase
MRNTVAKKRAAREDMDSDYLFGKVLTAIKRPFTLTELRTVLNLASDEWRSMVLFGLYSGQRLGDIATLKWNNIDLVHREQRLLTRKTGKAMTLPLAEPLRKHIALISQPGDPLSPIHPHPPEGF